MKKVLWRLGAIVLLIIGVAVVMKSNLLGHQGLIDKAIYINVAGSKPDILALRLKDALEHEGEKVIFSYKRDYKSGEFNLYIAEDIHNLPNVSDKKAINFLWINQLQNDVDPEILRPFDVIVVKNVPTFLHLKAINVRTAFIPNAIDIKDNTSSSNGKAMFFGDGDIYSLALSLAGRDDISLDVFGRNFKGKWPTDEIKADVPSPNDFREYSLVLVDQIDDDIKNEYISSEVIAILENGGLPYIRYNPAIEKLFGDAVPMYYNEEEFKDKLEFLLSHPEELTERRTAIFNVAKEWSSHRQAKKFIELFEIMERKRR